MGASSSRAHGILMVFGWVGASSTGQILAKHYRTEFPNWKFKGKDFWFIGHVLFMLLTVTLAVVAFIIIYSGVGRQSGSAHAVLGLIASLITFIQPIIGILRPSPESPKRFWFNWGHYLIGNFVHFLAIVNLYLASGFRTVQEKTGYLVVLSWYVLTHIFVDFVLTKLDKLTSRAEGGNRIGDAEDGPKTFSSPAQDKLIQNAPKLRKALLVGYLGVSWFIALILALMVGGAGRFSQPS